MKTTDLYTTAHLFVAAVRVLEHQHHMPPSIEGVSEALGFSKEHGHQICRKLSESGIVEVVSGAFGTKIYIKNHLALEDIPRGDTGSKLDEALKNFQSSKKELDNKIATIKAEQEDKKKKLYAELEKQLKSGKRK